MKKYIIYGTFECEVDAESVEDARAKFDIGDADAGILDCYEEEDDD